MAEESFTDALTERIAEEITKAWRSFDESPQRAVHKDRLRIAIHRTIIDELVIATRAEMLGESANHPTSFPALAAQNTDIHSNR